MEALLNSVFLLLMMIFFLGSGVWIFGALILISIISLVAMLGYPMDRVAFPTRVLAGLGVETLIITNAAGGINETYRPGQVVAIRDHINFMGDNPLRSSWTPSWRASSYYRHLLLV